MNTTKRQRHADKADLHRPLRTWLAAMNPERPASTSWMRYDLKPDNDNTDPDEEYVPTPLDTAYEARPSISELRNEWTAVDDEGRPLIGYGIQRNVPEYIASESSGDRAPKCTKPIVTRIGRLEFSNGEQVEKCLVLKDDRVVYGEVRIPAGGLVRFKGRKPWEKWRQPKGRRFPDTEPTVQMGGHNEGSTLYADPVEDVEWCHTLRALVGTEHAKVLDLACTAANFREIGEHFGKTGKNAERVGIKKLRAACARVEAAVAANDNISKKVAA